MNHILYMIILALILSGCRTKSRSVVKGNMRAEGNISKSGKYNGLIRFYDINTNKLKRQAVYKDDVLNGEQTRYHDNGSVFMQEHYENGKQNGYFSIYDSNNTILSKHYMYYDLLVGPTCYYKNGQISKYLFHSLHGDFLFRLVYDRLKDNTIEDVVEGTFFRFIIDSIQKYEGSISVEFYEYRIYTPSPPGFNFKYDMVLFDTTGRIDKIKKEIRPDHKNEFWITVYVPKNTAPLLPAIRLSIYDSSHRSTHTIFNKYK